MIVFSNLDANYPEDPIRFFDFEEYADKANDCALFYGGRFPQELYSNYDFPKFYFSTEEQSWGQDITDSILPYVDKVLTICPPSITGREKRQSAFFPTNPNMVPIGIKKEYDAVYTGYADAPHIDIILNAITQFNYRFVSFKSGGLVTDSNVSYQDKLNIIAASKCCVVHNLTSTGTPQLKSRPFEAAFCKSLMLVYKDDFNIIEEWFEPETEFLYFSTAEELKTIIEDATQNYNKYSNIVYNAFSKAINNYTTEKFVEKYIGLK